MKTITYLKVIMLVLCIMLASCSNDDTAPQEPPITEISLNQTQLTLNVQNTEKLSVTTEINDKSITWTSDAPDIVSIDENGNITALRGGVATISAQVDNAKATCIITVNPDVYVMGYRTLKGTIWKNGNIIKENLGFVRDFFVTEKGIYVLTPEKLFLNDEILLDLSNTSNSLEAIYVDGEDVYVCGQDRPSNSNSIAKMWKNGTEQILSDDRSVARRIVVSNGDVFVLGYRSENGITIWKNGIVTDMLDSNVTIVSPNLFIDGGDVYVGGTIIDNTKRKGAMWKNGIEISLEGNSTALQSIFVKDNDVYAVGNQFVGDEGNSKAVFWKNGIINDVTDGTSRQYGNDIAVFSNDVYITVGKYRVINPNTNFSTISSSITLFKNGQETILGVGSDLQDSFVGNKLFLY